MAKTLGSPRQKALIDFIVSRREVSGLTQAELAKRLGEYQSFVARLESGQRRVDVVEFLSLAEVLKFDPAKGSAAFGRHGRRPRLLRLTFSSLPPCYAQNARLASVCDEHKPLFGHIARQHARLVRGF